MIVTISLKDGSFTEVHDFKHLLKPGIDGPEKVTKDAIDDFMMKSTSNYTFVGEPTISLNSSEIQYISFNK